uniref:Uncharacterized protein n=1 Tax=Anguilla anguilla TaxID=7936 RepID=A0A0E9TJW9_ANGAN
MKRRHEIKNNSSSEGLYQGYRRKTRKEKKQNPAKSGCGDCV